MKTVKTTECYTFKIDGNEFAIELTNCVDVDYVFVDQSSHTVQCDGARKLVDGIRNLQEALYAVGYTPFQVYNRLKEAIALNGGELDTVKTIEAKDL